MSDESWKQVLEGTKRWTVIHGDSLTVLRALPPDSIDSLVTDPPAGIAFMQRSWDDFRRRENPNDVGRDNVFGRTSAHGPEYGRGARDVFVAWLTSILTEAYRVLKPGAHALVWALPKTSGWTHRACEDAGFEIRSTFHHVHGVGFPKALDAARAIDEHLGVERVVVGERTFTGTAALTTEEKGGTYSSGIPSNGASRTVAVTAATSDAAKRWQGWATALKPAVEHWILCRKEMSGTVAENLLSHGVGALNVEGTRVPTPPRATGTVNAHARSGAMAGIYGVDQRTLRQQEYDARQLGGRWPADFALSHTSECMRVGSRVVPGDRRTGQEPGSRPPGFMNVGAEPGEERPNGALYGDQVVDDYACSQGCPVRLLDEQSGERPGMSGGGVHRDGYQGGMFGAIDSDGTARNDTGGASRFFHNLTPDPLDEMPPFAYINKPSRSEREAGCESLPAHTAGDATGGREEGSAGLNSPRAGAGRTTRVGVHNNHSTVKSIALMRLLTKTVTPPGGTVIDIFTGSGTTGIACMLEGFRFIGIELNNTRKEPYVDIARARISYVAGGAFQPEARDPGEEAPREPPRRPGQQSWLK